MKKKGNRCVVKGCQNDDQGGSFHGDFCTPCWETITTGRVGHGTTFIHTLAQEKEKTERLAKAGHPGDLRFKGLTVAVHNDYRQDGQRLTFWLMVGPDGMSYKGEGRSDTEALNQIRDALNRRVAQSKPVVLEG